MNIEQLRSRTPGDSMQISRNDRPRAVATTRKSKNAGTATATVGQGKMAAAGWYKRQASFCTKLPTPYRGDRDHPVDENFTVNSKTTVAGPGHPIPASMFNHVSFRHRRSLVPISQSPYPLKASLGIGLPRLHLCPRNLPRSVADLSVQLFPHHVQKNIGTVNHG